MSRGDGKSKFSLTEDKTLYEEANFLHIYLDIPCFTFMLDETQIKLCIKNYIIMNKCFFIPFQKYDNSNPLKLMYPCLT